ncbi:hypothetical protein GN958_ATG10128 [Phytophthora infestans]|uniref:Uncharacterized protein n=1 Tax=Phytophthora infestans TaxID=4787 RepID=A0A8S9UIS3_PHYIN|nr:hypothetical protein GN958_ATG10128 [Phytophthora infestans]
MTKPQTQWQKTWYSRDVTFLRATTRLYARHIAKRGYSACIEQWRQYSLKKGVFVMIDEEEMPSKANLLSTMWRYRAKTDLEGFVDKWRARLVGPGDSQKLGIGYVIRFL